MNDEERLKKMMDRLNENSYYGIMTDTEITKIVRSHIKRLEDNEMKATSVQNIKNVKDICFSIENDPIEKKSKLIVVASTNDDIFAFEFEGSDLLQSCKKVGLFTGLENDETIKRKNREINELNQKLYQVERDKERLTDRYKDLEKQYNELSDEHAALRNVKIDQMRSNELLKRRNQQLKENAAKIAKENEELKTKSKDISNDNALLLETNKKLKEENERNKENLNSQHEIIRELIQKNFNEKLHNFEVNNKKYDGKIMEEILKRNSGRYSLDEEPSSRRDILKAAEKCVCGQREQDYGTPESNFQLIADLWNDYLGLAENGDGVPIFSIKNITTTDVAMMMALLKIARIKNGGGSGDSFVDLAGYAACGGEIWADKKSQKDQN